MPLIIMKECILKSKAWAYWICRPFSYLQYCFWEFCLDILYRAQWTERLPSLRMPLATALTWDTVFCVTSSLHHVTKCGIRELFWYLKAPSDMPGSFIVFFPLFGLTCFYFSKVSYLMTSSSVFPNKMQLFWQRWTRYQCFKGRSRWSQFSYCWSPEGHWR